MNQVEADLTLALVELHKGLNYVSLGSLTVKYDAENGMLSVVLRPEFCTPENVALADERTRPFASSYPMPPVWCMHAFTLYLTEAAKEGLEDCRRKVLARVVSGASAAAPEYDLTTPPYEEDFFWGAK